jgi:hypothetical protein
MQLAFDLGVGAIRSYKRLSYTAWYAMAEFVDNATQSYFDHREELDKAYEREGDKLDIRIVYDRDRDLLRITDNAMGMDRSELERALQVGVPPENPNGRCEFGMGMKTAACWVGDEWTVRTKKLGETEELRVTVDVEDVAAGNVALDVQIIAKPEDQHYTIIEIRRHHHQWVGRTLGKIKDYLRSMYRVDIREGVLDLYWQDAPLSWEESDSLFVRAIDGSVYRKSFQFDVNGKNVYGWVGVLERGSRAKAGFSIIRFGRVIRGWPDSWRPAAIFGQEGGSNDLINQRITGEVHLDGFIASHTKDDILWIGDEEEVVETRLKEAAADYIEVAKKRRKRSEDERGPSDVEVKTAIEEFQAELESGQLIDSVDIEEVPPPEVVALSFAPLFDNIDPTDPAFEAATGSTRIVGYLAMTASANDPYVAVDATEDDRVLVTINVNHPHWQQISGAGGVLNYFRDCTYDALAEWKARRAHQLTPETVKIFKDRFLRVGLQLETFLPEPETEAEAEFEAPEAPA